MVTYVVCGPHTDVALFVTAAHVVSAGRELGGSDLAGVVYIDLDVERVLYDL